jgi:BirA family biotin operon repressor/biotin-[acetyl-CoA-carboxylase] ligase
MHHFAVVRLDSVPSTNDYALERIRAGLASAGEVFAARTQPGARGRMGRRWIAEAGGLWFTVVMPLHGQAIGWSGMLAALAVCQALDEVELRAGVKWPNDVVIGGRKLAGVLVETVAGRELAAIGVGLNVSNPLPDVKSGEGPTVPASRPAAPSRSDLGPSSAWPPTSVARELGRDLAPEALLAPILKCLEAAWGLWADGRLEELRELWRARDVSVERPVCLLPDGLRGVAVGVDATGALLLRLATGAMHRALAGELIFESALGKGT